MTVKADADRRNCASYQAFHENFLVRLAESRTDVEHCQRLRYEVYCAERDWCEEIESVDGRDVDRFDDRAAHAMLFDRARDELIGTCRLVLPAAGGESPDLPIEEITGWPPSFTEAPPPNNQVGEISRFAVTKAALQHEWSAGASGEQEAPASEAIWTGESTALPNISIGLLRGIFLMARRHGIEYLVASMEPALVKLFARIDVRFDACGKPHRYHGIRKPCHAQLTQIAESLRNSRPVLYRIIFEEPPAEAPRKLVS